MIINWLNIKRFKKKEFRPEEIDHASPKLITALDRQRHIFTRLEDNKIYPSCVKGALARFDDKSEGSQHYAVDRLSTGIDWFPGKKGTLQRIYELVMASQLWGGIGIYFDTHGYEKSRDVMFHTDMRPLDKHPFTLVWYRRGGKYFYPQFSDKLMVEFHRLLKERG